MILFLGDDWDNNWDKPASYHKEHIGNTVNPSMDGKVYDNPDSVLGFRGKPATIKKKKKKKGKVK